MLVIARRWRLILAGLVLGVVLAGALAAYIGPVYEARARLLVMAAPGPNARSAYENERFSQQRMATYARLAEGARFGEAVGSPAGTVRAQVVGSSTALDLIASNVDSAVATELAADAANRMAGLIERIDPKGVASVVVTIPAEVTSGPGYTRILVIGLAVGLVLGIFAAAVVAGIGAHRTRSSPSKRRRRDILNPSPNGEPQLLGGTDGSSAASKDSA